MQIIQTDEGHIAWHFDPTPAKCFQCADRSNVVATDQSRRPHPEFKQMFNTSRAPLEGMRRPDNLRLLKLKARSADCFLEGRQPVCHAGELQISADVTDASMSQSLQVFDGFLHTALVINLYAGHV